MAGYIINLSWPLEVASSTLPLPTSLRTQTDMSAMFDNGWIRDYNNAMLGEGAYKCFPVELVEICVKHFEGKFHTRV